MTDDESDSGEGADRSAGTDRVDRGSPPARAPWAPNEPDADDEVKHSALVGFMSVPISRRFPVRRSTFVMALAFAGLATLLYLYPPQSTDTGTGVVLHTSQGDVFVPNATPVSTTTTTTSVPPPTTTTMVFSPTTTTTPTTSSTSTSTSTTTTVPGGGGSGSTGTAPTSSGSPGTTGSSGFGAGGTTTTTPR